MKKRPKFWLTVWVLLVLVGMVPCFLLALKVWHTFSQPIKLDLM